VRHRFSDPAHSHSPRYRTSQGTGFFISEDGYAVTNNHVIEGSSAVEVRTDAGQVFRANVVAVDPVSDLALLKADNVAHLGHVSFSHRPPKIGDWVVAVGSPFGLGGTVTAGIVSASGRDLANEKDLLQIDAPINRGNSGGPTFDLEGNVVGVNTMILSPTGGSIGLGFAIPAARAERILAQLKDTGAVTRGWLGIQYQALSSELAATMGFNGTSGVVVSEVLPGGPATKAGVQVGDLIVSTNRRPVSDAHQFSQILENTAPGTPLALGIVRAGRGVSVEAVVELVQPRGNKSSEPSTQEVAHQELGLAMVPGSEFSTGANGVVVISIDPSGLAAGRGVDAGDVIVEVEHHTVMTPDEVFSIIADARKAGKQSVLVRTKSGDNAQFVVLPTG
jgi:serine protease Do